MSNPVLGIAKIITDRRYKLSWDKKVKTLLAGKSGDFPKELQEKVTETWNPYIKVNTD